MWIYLNNSFLSIVAHNDKPEHMHVRGRRRGDIEAVFPEANVTDTPDRDYAFRADISRTSDSPKIAEWIGLITFCIWP